MSVNLKKVHKIVYFDTRNRLIGRNEFRLTDKQFGNWLTFLEIRR